ncbi:MAG: cytochrome c oxidase accessory protein CcoG [Opitutales bacterium]|nr:cytochrome c oxidase accessory protein CcoG [Opitutales bacterium]
MARHAPSLNSLSSIRDDGSRRFLHPADVRGRFTRLRYVLFFAIILLYAILPWIPVNGAPAVFLDVSSRRFHLFGYTFVSQDFWLVFFLITGLAFTLFYVTSILGRVWCGYACPHTVFLEGLFRRVERLIDGDARKRQQLDQASWTPGKVVRRVVKHGIYLLLALLIAHIFISYFVSIPRLYGMISASPMANSGVFLWMVILTGILYFNFSWFREQLCIIICPYGRLQSALIDDDSIVIGYDEKRGEPRGKVTDPNAGDCIDCRRCVDVCPTGIDIRQGLQMECIGCAACVDACDEIMDRVKRPRGLVRYDSLNGLAGKARRILRPRTFLYTALFLLGAAIFTFSLRSVEPVTFSATRMGGGSYFLEEDAIRNQFNVRFINKENHPREVEVAVDASSQPIRWRLSPQTVLLEPGEERVVPFFLYVDREHYEGGFAFTLTAILGEDHYIEREMNFLGPDRFPETPLSP